MKIKKIASGSSGNCFLYNNNLLIECGISMKKIEKGVDYSVHDLTACLLSHEHRDHSKSVESLEQRCIEIYMSKGTHDALSLPDSCFYHFLEAGKMVKINDYNIMPFEVYHDHEFMPCKEPLGFLIKHQDDQLVFITDTSHVKYQFPGTTHFMIECNYSEELINKSLAARTLPKSLYDRIRCTHFSLEQVKIFFEANDLSTCEEIHLIHISLNNGNAELFQETIQELTGKPVYV